MSSGEQVVLTVLRPASGGSSVAFHEGQTVFVSGAIPGEVVRATIQPGSGRVLRAQTLEVLEPSEHRVPDRREALGVPGAGGIEFAHVTLPHARSLKEETARDQLTRIGALTPEEFDFRLLPAPAESAEEREGLMSADEWGTRWRTRVQSAVDANGRLGMFAPHSHAVVPYASDRIPLAVDAFAGVGLHELRLPGVSRVEWAAGDGFGAVVLRGRSAREQVKAITALTADWAGEWSVFAETPGKPERTKRKRRPARAAGGRNRGGASAQPLALAAGDGYIWEQVEGITRTLRVRGDGFWQVHRDADALLSREVRQAVGVPGPGVVLDLYCGAGLLGIALAEDGHRVVGIEGSDAAVEDARVNAEGLDAQFHAGRVESAATYTDARVAVLDPPRAGAGPQVVAALIDSTVERIVHVSCDGATLARDIKGLVAGGFTVTSLEAFDLFPLTGHAEFVAVLDR